MGHIALHMSVVCRLVYKSPKPFAINYSRMLYPRSFRLGRLIALDEEMLVPIALIVRSVGQESKSKVKPILLSFVL